MLPEVLARAFTPEEAHEVAAWAYDPPFDFYNLSSDDAVALLTSRDERGYGYYPVKVAEELVGFLCFGPEARVRGQSEEPHTCDVGAGLRPDRLGAGIATRVMPTAIALAAETFAPRRLRAAVAVFNERSLRLCASAGFRQLREFDGPRDQRFVELVRSVAPRAGAVRDGRSRL